MRLFPATWTLRAGPVVRRETIPLADVIDLSAGGAALRYLTRGQARDCVVRISSESALFAAPNWMSPFDEAAIVNKGSVSIRGDKVEVAYRASFGATLFLTIWFALLFAFVVTLFVAPQRVPLLPVAASIAMMLGVAIGVRYSARSQIRILRGIAVEAAMGLARERSWT